MPRFVCLLIIVALSLLFSSPGYTVTEIPKEIKPITSISLTPTISGYLFSSSQALNPTALFGLKFSYDHLGMSMANSLGLDATVNYFSTSATTGGKASGYLVRGDVIYSAMPRNKWVPFLAVGVGELFVEKDSSHDQNFLMNYGLGVKYFLENYLALRVDARQVFVYKNTVGTSNNFELSTGLTYYFGKERIKKGVLPPKAKPAVMPKPVPDIVDTDSAPEAPDAVLEKLGVTGPAVTGITSAPGQFQPEPPIVPGPGPKVFNAPMGPGNPPPIGGGVPLQSGPGNVAPVEPMAAPMVSPTPVPAPAPAAPAPLLVPGKPVLPSGAKEVKSLTVEFDPGSSVVGPSYKAQLIAIAALVSATPKAIVLIEAPAEQAAKGSKGQVLAQRRAQSVKEILVKHGVKPQRATIKVPGSTKLKANQKTRRAVIFVVVTFP